MEYTYSVNGTEYTGNRYSFGDKWTSLGPWHNQVVQDFPSGSMRTCYYDPKHVNRAVLKSGVQGGDILMLMFLTPFNVLAFGFVFGSRSRHFNWDHDSSGPVATAMFLR